MLKRWINTGVRVGMPEMQARKTRIVNLSALLASGLLSVFVGVMLLRELWANAVIYSLLAGMAVTTLYFNRIQRHTLARLYSLGVVAFILICMEFLMRGESKYIYIVCLMLLGIFLAESRREALFVFLSAILIYLFHYVTPYLVSVEDIPNETPIGQWINITVGSFTVVVIVEIFKSDGRRYEELLSRSNLQLKEKRAEADEQRAITQRKAQKLAAKNSEATIVNRDIQDSIRYARRIQTSMLLTKAQLRHRLPDSLVFFKPKDVLSGDFYWFTEVDGYLFVALADCTGHGVPGAMMTVLGNNLLHQIVGHDNMLGPAVILEELDSRITALLGQGATAKDTVRDGMDMALVRIDRGSDTILFASAKRPMYAFHGTGGELTEYPASRQSIGGLMTDKKRFVEQGIPFMKGDIFYLTSDGYVDQFGPQGKFMSKRFRKLLRDIYRKPMAEQHRLLNETFLRWKVAEPQTDDIIVFGFRMENAS